MVQQIVLPKYSSKLEEQLIKTFHDLGLPLHSNKTGNKEFTNYQRFSLIINFYRSKSSLREFVDEKMPESKWISWLGLKRIPTKSTLHRWLKIFDLEIIRKILRTLSPENVELTAIDGTGFDSWQRSRHYEKRIGEVQAPPMPYAKVSLFVDVKSQMILDFDMVLHHEHDVKGAERIFKRNCFENIFGLGDKGYDSEPLHEIARANGIIFYAPVRKTDKKSSKKKKPNGKYRRQCMNPPDFAGMRSIVETINSVLKRTQISSLRSKKPKMKKREFGWQAVVYNLKKIVGSSSGESQTFLFFKFHFFVFWDRAYKTNV